MKMTFKPHHTAISVRDAAASVSFYEGLGYRQVHRYDEGDGSLTIVHLKLGESILEIFAYAKNSGTKEVDWEYANNLQDIGVKHLALSTDNLEAALEDFRSKGIATEQTQIRAGRTGISYFFIKDPDGVWVEIVNDDRK